MQVPLISLHQQSYLWYVTVNNASTECLSHDGGTHCINVAVGDQFNTNAVFKIWWVGEIKVFCRLSFGWFSGGWISCSEVLEHWITGSGLSRNVGMNYEDGTVFWKCRHIKFRRWGIAQKKAWTNTTQWKVQINN